jgi:hypothetical protein
MFALNFVEAVGNIAKIGGLVGRWVAKKGDGWLSRGMCG